MNGNVSEKTSAYAGKGHSLRAMDRNAMEVRGVTDVVSFDEESVCMTTTCGYMVLEGEGLHVGTLNTKDGVVEITGKLCGLFYEDTDASSPEIKGKGRKGRFFR